MADIYSKTKRSEIMASVKSRRTGPEEKVAKILREGKIQYRRNVKSLPGKPDFVVKSANTIIFVHGCFWHGHKNCKYANLPKSNKKFWREKVIANKRRDSRVYRGLRRAGWHIITVWQCRLKQPERVAKRVGTTIQKNSCGR